MRDPGLEQEFPGLAVSDYQLTSPSDPCYNCIAWAAGVSDRWWWPDRRRLYYWPPGVPREASIEAFVLAFQGLDYEVRSSPDWEDGFEKVALYAHGTKPTHMARQVARKRWTSKCGQSFDVDHAPEGLEGSIYGKVVVVLRRRRQ